MLSGTRAGMILPYVFYSNATPSIALPNSPLVKHMHG